MLRKKLKILDIREILDEGYSPLPNLLASKNDIMGYVLLQGDDGGQIYLTIPASKVKLSEDELGKLLATIDGSFWANPRAAKVYYLRARPGQHAPAGMGGGEFTPELWIHPDIPEKLKTKIQATFK